MFLLSCISILQLYYKKEKEFIENNDYFTKISLFTILLQNNCIT